MRAPPLLALSACACALLGASGCRDVSTFTSGGDRFEGPLIPGDFVRAGTDGAALEASAVACLTLDVDHLQDAPGALSTSDGRFHLVPLRPIPQIWHDPLSTLSFGEGRLKNLIYVATPSTDAGGDDVMVVVSLMQAGDVEVRLIRGAPALGADAAPASGGVIPLFAVFDLTTRGRGPCSY